MATNLSLVFLAWGEGLAVRAVYMLTCSRVSNEGRLIFAIPCIADGDVLWNSYSPRL